MYNIKKISQLNGRKPCVNNGSDTRIAKKRSTNISFEKICDHCGVKGHKIRDCPIATDIDKANWLEKFRKRKNAKRKQPEEAKTCLEAIAPNDVNKHLAKAIKQPSTSAHTVTATDVTAAMHEIMQCNIGNKDTLSKDSDKSHRPEQALKNSDKSHRP